jgi:membrane-associated protease RseP (regulator of RpoE activity)
VSGLRRVSPGFALLFGVMLLVPVGAAIGLRFLTAAPVVQSLGTATQASAAPVASEVPAQPPQVRGRILDESGDAVAGAIVHLVSAAPAVTVLAETMSDATGAFSVAHVGTVRLRVDAEHAPQGAVRSAELQAVEGQSVEVTLVLGQADIRGTVVDEADDPVASAAVSVEGVPWPVAGATTDATGAFQLTGVPFEATAVVAVASGYKSARARLPAREDQPEPVLRLQLLAASPVDGDVLDPDGKPAHARIVACEGQPAEARVTSGDDGTFRLPPSAIGCDAIALSDDFAPSDVGRVVEGQRLVLRLAAGGGIEGVVVDARGLRLSAFSLGIESYVGSHGGSARGRGPRPFEAGVFRWEGLAPGTYVLTAIAPGNAPARSDPVDVRGGAVTSGVRIVLSAGGTVTGHVYDDRHAPVAGARLGFDRVSTVVESTASATTDDSGGYRLEGAPDGPFTLMTQKDGYRVRMLSGLRVASGGTLTQDVTLTPADGGASFELGGIGAGLAARADGIVFASVFPGDPAERSGLRAGDRVLRIDGEDTAGMSITDALQRLRGEVGTSVGISVRRDSTGDTVDVVVVRATIAH